MDYSVGDGIWYGLICLFGEEGTDWEFYETNWDWWTLRLWTRRN